MAGRGMEGSLFAQMDRLKRTMQNRDKRRDQERRLRQRTAEADGADPYSKPRGWEPANATGGVRLGPAAAATAAIALAEALQGPELIHCHLCQVSFRGEAEMRQHVDGPIHRKAEAREAKRRQEEESRSAMGGVAEAALAAAAWANDGKLGSGRVSGTAASGPPGGPRSGRDTGPSGGPTLAAPFQWGHAGKDGGRGRGRRGRGGESNTAEGGGRGRGRGDKPPPPPPERTHQEVLAEMRRTAEPLNIGGWVPPSITAPRPSALPFVAASDQVPPSGLDGEEAEGPDGTPGAEACTKAVTGPAQELPERQASEGGDAEEVAEGGGLASLLGYGEGGSGSDEDGEASGSADGSDSDDAPATELTSFF